MYELLSTEIGSLMYGVEVVEFRRSRRRCLRISITQSVLSREK